MKEVKRDNRAFVENLKGQKCFLCDWSLADLIVEERNFIVILDAFPAVMGHIICAPKKHYKSLSELNEVESQELILLVRKLDRALRTIFNPFRVAIVSSGLAVEHLHFHVVPIPNEEMMWDFKYLRKDKTIAYTEKEKTELIDKIKKAL